jgi:putative ABC transport system ATP-binding protein
MIITAKNVYKDFLQGPSVVSAVKDVSFELEEGKTLALTGPSGSGKTTIMSLLAGLDSPTKGEVTVAGVNLGSLSEKKLSDFRAHQVGIVFQQFHLMPHLTALENVCLPLEIGGLSDVREKALEILTAVGLRERAGHLPGQLSGGEKQRVAIARALVLKPKVILADEPSGNLDAETGNAVMDLLFGLVKEHRLSLVLVTHNNLLAKKCDEQINLMSGSLIKSEVL